MRARERAGQSPRRRPSDRDRTRERLLVEARRLFAEHGLKKVTVREICRAARANVAAVNYHFGDKMGLYREVLQQAIDGMARSNDEARAAGEGCRPEEKLRRFLRIFLSRLIKPEFAVDHRLVQRELQDPTPMLDAFVTQGIKPRLPLAVHEPGGAFSHRLCHPREGCVFLSQCSVDECDVKRRNIGLPGSLQKALQDLLRIAPPASKRISVRESRKIEGAEEGAVFVS